AAVKPRVHDEIGYARGHADQASEVPLHALWPRLRSDGGRSGNRGRAGHAVRGPARRLVLPRLRRDEVRLRAARRVSADVRRRRRQGCEVAVASMRSRSALTSQGFSSTLLLTLRRNARTSWCATLAVTNTKARASCGC